MALADIYKVRITFLIGGELCENVFFYERLNPASDADALLTAFSTDVAAKIVGVVVNNVVFQNIFVESLGDLTDFDVSNLIATGGQIGNYVDPGTAINMTLRTGTRAIRPGSKRFGTIPADMIVDGVLQGSAGYMTQVEDLRAQMVTGLGGVSDDDFQHVIVKRVKYHPVGKPTVWAYRLPETDEELVSSPVISALVNLNISHQDTRDNGR